jgi:hypothetical protein
MTHSDHRPGEAEGRGLPACARYAAGVTPKLRAARSTRTAERRIFRGDLTGALGAYRQVAAGRGVPELGGHAPGQLPSRHSPAARCSATSFDT